MQEQTQLSGRTQSSTTDVWMLSQSRSPMLNSGIWLEKHGAWNLKSGAGTSRWKALWNVALQTPLGPQRELAEVASLLRTSSFHMWKILHIPELFFFFFCLKTTASHPQESASTSSCGCQVITRVKFQYNLAEGRLGLIKEKEILLCRRWKN